MSAALTGPGASTVAGAAEGLKLYIDQLNKAGGVNGRQVKLIVQDDQGEPSKAAANAKKLLNQDNVTLLINTSLSSTFAPMVAEAQRVGVTALCWFRLSPGSLSAGKRVSVLHNGVLGGA
jgi:branched-chain amino acid transport system substrate-binding protein